MTSVSTSMPESSGAGPGTPPVRDGEQAWTAEEIEAVQAELHAEIARIAAEVEMTEADLVELMQNDGGGAGDDTADAGGKVAEREQELTLARHSRTLLEQSRLALGKLAEGSYGVCEQCAEPIGKARLQAFPRATLCVACKQKTERR